MTLRAAVAAAVIVAACSACGSSGSPTSPSNPPTTSTPPPTPTPTPTPPPPAPWTGPDFSGAWAGTWTYKFDDLRLTDDATVTFSLSSGAMVGQLTSGSGATGLVTLLDPAALTGTFALTVTTVSGGSCFANGTVTAVVTGTQMRLTVPAVQSASPECATWATDNVLELTKR